MNEEQALSTFLYTTLSGDTAVAALVGTRIFEDLAPQGTAFPFVVFSFHTGGDTNALGSDVRTLTRPQYLIRAISKGPTYSDADAVAAAVDAALMGAHGSATVNGVTYEVLTVFREQAIRRCEYAESVRYNHAGGLYRIPCYRSS